jgi:cell division protein FtsQ
MNDWSSEIRYGGENILQDEQKELKIRTENHPEKRRTEPSSDSDGIQDDMLKSLFKLIKIALVLVSGFFVVKLYSAWLVNSDSFKIKKIEIEGNELISSQKIMKDTGLESGKRIWEIDLRSAEEEIRSNPFIDTVHLERSFPNVLKIRIREKYPIALLNFKNCFYGIDEKGMILPSKSGILYDLPVLSGHHQGSVTMGQTIDSPNVMKELAFLKQIIRERTELYGEISEVAIGQNGLILYTRKGGIPVHIGEGGYDWKIRYLEAVVKQIYQKSDIQKIKYIDLRYNNQVVVGERA